MLIFGLNNKGLNLFLKITIHLVYLFIGIETYDVHTICFISSCIKKLVPHDNFVEH